MEPRKLTGEMPDSMDRSITTDVLSTSPSQKPPAMEVTQLSLEALRMNEAKKLAMAIVAEAEQFDSDPMKITQDSLRTVLEASESLVYKLRNWTALPNVPSGRGDFHRFPKLPVELQLMIWRNAIPTSRTLTLYLKFNTTKLESFIRHQDRDPTGAEAMALRREWKNDLSKYRIRVRRRDWQQLLWVCQQSRKEVLRIYTLCLSTEGDEFPFRIHPDSDTILFKSVGRDRNDTNFETGKLWDKHARNSIKHVAFDTASMRTLLRECQGNPFQDYLALKDITIVTHESQCGVKERFLRSDHVNYDVADFSPRGESIDLLDDGQELQRRFETFALTNPCWPAPAILLKSLVIETKTGLRRCCEIPWKERQSLLKPGSY